MVDRRRSVRSRVFMGGRLAFNHRHSTMDCVVRNLSEGGARIVLPRFVLLPPEMDFVVPSTDRSYRARVAWQDDCDIGLSFLDYNPAATIVPIDLAVRIRGLEGERRRLRQRIDQLGG